MGRHILIIQGHPDTAAKHFGHALAEAYRQGAAAAGHETRTLTVAELDLPLLSSYEDFYHGEPSLLVRGCQEDIRWADHLVFFYPLWLGSMPALLKGFLEQVFRPGFAMQPSQDGRRWRQLLKGKSAHIVVTMGMPALVYRWYFGAHSLKSLERNILRFCGIGPIRESLVGSVEGSADHRERWLAKLRGLASKA
jgi:putative NADPH-quinone reductase